jgi:hypothetical protein
MKWFLILWLGLVACQVKAQDTLGVRIVSFPTSGIIGDTAGYSGIISLHNYGTQTVSDSMYLEYEVGGIIYNSKTPNAGLFFWDTINIAPQDSETKQISIHFTPTIFRTIGTSGVVIWPICPYDPHILADTTTWSPVLTYPESIAGTYGEKLLVYMDGSQLYIKMNAENLLKRVRIYAINGKLIEEQDLSSSGIITMDKYAAGMYIAEVMFADGSLKTYKIVNIASH